MTSYTLYLIGKFGSRYGQVFEAESERLAWERACGYSDFFGTAFELKDAEGKVIDLN